MEDISPQQEEVIHQMEAFLDRLEGDRHVGRAEAQEIGDAIRQYISDSDEELHPRFQETWDQLINIVPVKIFERNHRRTHYTKKDVSRRGPHTAPIGAIDEIIDERSPLKIPDLDIQDDDDVVFLLGAGASVASDIPTVNGLLDVLLDQARRTQREDLEPLIQYCDEQDDIDIEDLLTAAYLADFAVTDKHITRLLFYFLFTKEDSSPEDTPPADPTSVNFIQDTLRTLFGSITSAMIPKDPNPTHEAIRNFVERHDRSTIVTTNYDYCMDQELLDNGVGLGSTIDRENPEDFDQTVDLLKMHGSINWWYCDSCQLVSNIPPSEVKKSLDTTSPDYAVLGICPDCHGQRRPLLVPPISFKFLIFPPLIEIWNKAREEIISADYIVPVGYSFSDSDAYIYNLISKSMKDQDDTTLILIDPDSDVTDRLRDRFTAELGDFDSDERVIGLHEVSQEAVPKFVNEVLQVEEQTEIEDAGTLNRGEQETGTDD